MPELPRLSAAEIQEKVSVLSRDPFMTELSRLLECAPDTDALKAFAARNPGAWVNALRTLAPLSGYKEHAISGDTNIYMQINSLPDSELHQILQDTLRSINDMETVPAIEGEKIET